MMVAARADVKRASDTCRAEPEAGTDFAYGPCLLATTASER
jgi:hypothetical protein